MAKRFATIRSRMWRAAHYFNRRHDAAWPFTTTPVAANISVSTSGSPVNIDLGAAVALGRLIYVNGQLVYTGSPGVDVGDTALVTPANNARAGTVTWVSPNLVFTPRAGYTGAVAFSYTLSDGRRRNTGNATGTVT